MYDDRFDSVTQPSRRHLLGLIGAAAVLPLAGCIGDDDNGTPTPTPTPTGDPVPPTDDVPGEDAADVPRYPDSVRTYFLGWEQHPGVFDIWYISAASIDDILDFYTTNLPDHDWTNIHSDQWEEEWQIHAGKSNVDLVITIQPSPIFPGYNTIEIGRYVVTQPDLPTEDYPGEDFDDVPRYPDSIRTSYSDFGTGSRSVSYLSEATLEDIVAFYETQLPDHGWDIDFSEPYWDEEWEIWAEKDGAWLSLAIEPSWYFDGYHEIWMYYLAPPPQES